MSNGVRFSGDRLALVRGERLVFAGLSFNVESGGALVLTGPNGSGKSSLLRLMAWLGRPEAGRMTWNTDDIAADPEAHYGRTHYVGHLDAIKPVLRVGEQVALWCRLRGFAARDAHARTIDALERLGIGHLRDLPGRYLSAGQRRRVSLARLLAVPAPLWLLDEPWTALDADAVERLDEMIAEHRASGRLVVLSLHGGTWPPGAFGLDLAQFAPIPISDDEEAEP